MKQKILHYSKEAFLFIIIMGIFLNIVSYYKSQNINAQYIDLNNSMLTNETKYIQDSNKPLLVHVWAIWCPICKVEAPNINRIAKEYEVVTIAVNSGSDEDINKYLKDNNLNYKVINDINGVLATKYNISVFPSTFIYDKNSSILFTEVGYTSTIGLYFRMLWSSI